MTELLRNKLQLLGTVWTNYSRIHSFKFSACSTIFSIVSPTASSATVVERNIAPLKSSTWSFVYFSPCMPGRSIVLLKSVRTIPSILSLLYCRQGCGFYTTSSSTHALHILSTFSVDITRSKLWTVLVSCILHNVLTAGWHVRQCAKLIYSPSIVLKNSTFGPPLDVVFIPVNSDIHVSLLSPCTTVLPRRPS